MFENFILLGIGLLGFSIMAVVGEVLAKVFDWE